MFPEASQGGWLLMLAVPGVTGPMQGGGAVSVPAGIVRGLWSWFGIAVQVDANPKLATLNLAVICRAAIGHPDESTEVLFSFAVKVFVCPGLASILSCEWSLVMSLHAKLTPLQVLARVGSWVASPQLDVAGVFTGLTVMPFPVREGQKYWVAKPRVPTRVTLK